MSNRSMLTSFIKAFEKRAYQESSDMLLHMFHKPEKEKTTWDKPDYNPKADAIDAQMDQQLMFGQQFIGNDTYPGHGL